MNFHSANKKWSFSNRTESEVIAAIKAGIEALPLWTLESEKEEREGVANGAEERILKVITAIRTTRLFKFQDRITLKVYKGFLFLLPLTTYHFFLFSSFPLFLLLFSSSFLNFLLSPPIMTEKETVIIDGHSECNSGAKFDWGQNSRNLSEIESETKKIIKAA